MSKKLCKLAKEDYLKEHLKEYVALVKPSKYICKKCGRVGHSEENLCKSKKIKE